MRLQQFLAHCGIASRRKAEELIALGEVSVNGKVISEPGTKVDPEKDSVKYRGRLIKKEKYVYLVLNKPAGFICSASDEKGRPTVMDILPPNVKARVYPVGRLDFNTTGCLIITNDGSLANMIMHPRFEVEKYYTAKIKGRLTDETAARLMRGVLIDVDGEKPVLAKAKRAGILKKHGKNDIIFITITEGMNHQIKKMLQAVGLPPVRLHRESVGPVTVKGLMQGAFRDMTEREIQYFRREAKNGKRHKGAKKKN
ncbi:MAG TPA: rRNA pseudouridine synthase [bacterium]|nr:rRNA pseudouridine synthase [bacterium]